MYDKYFNKQLTKLLYTFLLLLFSFVSSDAQNSRENPKFINTDSLKNGVFFVNLEWKYAIGDNLECKNFGFDDNAWKYSNILQMDSLKPNEVAWLRYYFKVDSSLLSVPIFLNITQQGASETFLNGKKIDSLGTIHSGAAPDVHNIKTLPTPFVFADTGIQVLAIRFQKGIYEESSIGNFTHSGINLYFGTYQSSVIEGYIQDRRLFSAGYWVIGIFLALSFIHLLLFAFFRKALYNFFFGIYNLSIAMLVYCIVRLMVAEYIASEEKYFNLLVIAVAMFGFSLTGFVNTLFGRSRIRKYILLAIPLLCIVVYQFEQDWSALILAIYTFFVAFESFYLIIRAMLRKEKSAFIIGSGIIVFFCVIVIIIGAFLLNGGSLNTNTDAVGRNLGFMLAMIGISFPVSISAYLAWQFAATNFKLQTQLSEVEKLSAYTLQQEQEKQNILEHQNENLEIQVAERTQELQIEKKKSDDLLLNILPQEVAEELKATGTSKAQHHDEVSVLFTDFVNFTMASEQLGAEELLEELNENFTAFDRIMEKHGLEKIKTIGDAYLAVSGLPVKDERHAQNTVAAALDIIAYVQERKANSKYGLDIRIGIHSGPLVAGIVGVKKFAFDIWGDTVNTAARMEQSSEAGKVNISESTFQLVKNEFNCEARGRINAKGKGEMEMYFVNYK